MSDSEKKDVSLDQNGNLIFQSYFIIELLLNLQSNGFVKSDYFDKMPFRYPTIKELIKKVDIDNQGMLLLTLYAMLVIPKEILQTAFSSEFDTINTQLAGYCRNTITNYNSDNVKVDFIRHLRNAVAHGRISFVENSVMKFEDEYGSQKFESEIPLMNLHKLIDNLLQIHKKYLTKK